MNYSEEVKNQANDLIRALYRFGVCPDVNVLSHIEQIRYMVRLAKSHHRLQEHACNGELSKRQETRIRNIERDVTEIAAMLGLTATFEGDPRGYTVKLHLTNVQGFYNTWGGQDSEFGI